MVVRARVVLQLRFLDDSGLGEYGVGLLSMEYVCSQAIPGSDSSCKWEAVGTKDGSVVVSVMTNVLKLKGVSMKSSI